MDFKWDCGKQGCYVKKVMPKFDSIRHLFPGDVRLSDIDGIVELRGHFLCFEIKPYAKIGDIIKEGQMTLYDRFSRQPNSISVILWLEDTTDLKTVKVAQFLSSGKIYRKEHVTFPKFSGFIERWVKQAMMYPVFYDTIVKMENTLLGGDRYTAPLTSKPTGKTIYDFT